MSLQRYNFFFIYASAREFFLNFWSFLCLSHRKVVSLRDFFNRMMRKYVKHSWICLLVVCLCAACGRPPVPKEYGYYRIELPPHNYVSFQRFSSGSQAVSGMPFPYTFLLSSEAEVRPVKSPGDNFWIDIVYPKWNAMVHCSYKPVENNLYLLSDDAQEFVYSHAVKASAIPEREYADPEHRVFGLSFDLQGNTASVMQFFLTDSTRHFFRGSLYFNNIPNQDSIQPVAQFIREDMITLIESFRWVKPNGEIVQTD